MTTTNGATETKSAFNARYGKWLREMREEVKMSPNEIAAAVGISVQTVNQCENGATIELYDAMRLCNYFGVDA